MPYNDILVTGKSATSHPEFSAAHAWVWPVHIIYVFEVSPKEALGFLTGLQNAWSEREPVLVELWVLPEAAQFYGFLALSSVLYVDKEDEAW